MEFERDWAVKGWLQVLLAETIEYLMFPLTQAGTASGGTDQRCKGRQGEAKIKTAIIIQLGTYYVWEIYQTFAWGRQVRSCVYKSGVRERSIKVWTWRSGVWMVLKSMRSDGWEKIRMRRGPKTPLWGDEGGAYRDQWTAFSEVFHPPPPTVCRKYNLVIPLGKALRCYFYKYSESPTPIL